MGLYIKGIEMPTNDEMLYIKIYPNGKVAIDMDLECKQIATAFPVPPHGGLIERKAIYLTDFEISMCNGDYKEGMKMLLEKIESAPTIIPAEEGE